jgi:hypothetical protein
MPVFSITCNHILNPDLPYCIIMCGDILNAEGMYTAKNTKESNKSLQKIDKELPPL